MKHIGEFCRLYRIATLKLNLKTFSSLVDENFKNISAFEHGRANNIKYLFYYYKLSDEDTKQFFIRELFKVGEVIGEET